MNTIHKSSISIVFFILTISSVLQIMACELVSEKNISKYELVKGPIYMEGVTKNASGLTYDVKTGTLYLVINKPAQIIQLSTTGKFIRKIDLIGFSDVEAITILSENRFVIAEEANALLHFVNIQENTTAVSLNDVIETIKIDNPKIMVLKKKNKKKLQTNGIEALGLNTSTRVLWIAKEKKPQKLYIIDLNKNVRLFPAKEPWNIEHLGLKDISGLTILQKIKHLLLLSDKSSKIVETTLDGKIVSTLDLAINNIPIPDAEGIATDNQGHLYVCSEPNILFIFSKTP